MGKETLRSELIKFTSTLINGYTGESTILELLGTNDCIDDYVDNQLRERWQLTMPDVKVGCNDKYIDEAALKAYPPLMINGEEYWEERYDAHTEHREAFIKGATVKREYFIDLLTYEENELVPRTDYLQMSPEDVVDSYINHIK